MENGAASHPDAWDYSAILIRRTRSTLIERYGEPITDEVVARHLEVETECIRAIMDGKSKLGTDFFLRQANGLDQTLVKFTADLIRWHRKDIGVGNDETDELS